MDIILGWFAKCTFNPARDIPDQSGRVFLITGAYSGIGYEATKQLVAKGATVYLACRSKEKTLASIARLEEEVPSAKDAGRLRFLQVDMSDMHSVKKAAEEFLSKERRLDVLVNNAGRMNSAYELSKDGVELSLAVNHLGVSVLTEALLPVLKATAAEPNSDVRIVVVSSRMYMDRPGGAIDKLDTLEGWNDYGGNTGNGVFAQNARYAMTKYMNILWVKHLQKVLDKEQPISAPITAVSLHPGIIATKGIADHFPLFVYLAMRLIGITPTKGSYTTLFAATSPSVKAERSKFAGAYLIPYGKVAPLTKDARDEKRAKILWEATEKVKVDIFTKHRETAAASAP